MGWNHVFLNDGTGHFTESWSAKYWGGQDGAWAEDINMDGSVDLVCGGMQVNMSYYPFYALLNDGTGTHFDTVYLAGTDTFGYSYQDGAMAADIDLDGYPDIVGAWGGVGFFRQKPSAPLTFDLHNVGYVNGAHWVYAASLYNKCMPSIDLLVTCVNKHVVFENRMLGAFASIGHLESSILEMIPTDSLCVLEYFGYNACVPNDTALAFYWRAGVDSANIIASSWNGPIYATAGMNIIDSFSINGSAKMFQYKVQFKGSATDIATLYEVWMTADCSASVEEKVVSPVYKPDMQFVRGELSVSLPHRENINLAIYDIAGKLRAKLFNGYLDAGTYAFAVPDRMGIYLARCRYGKNSTTLKFVKLR